MITKFNLFENSSNIRNEKVSLETVSNLAGRFYNERQIKFVHEKINDLLNTKTGKIILYRILMLENPSDLDTSNLGNHYTMHTYHDERFLYDIGIMGYEDTKEELIEKYEKLYLIELESPISEISIDENILNLLEYPDEDEITLKDNPNVKIISVDNYQHDDS